MNDSDTRRSQGFRLKGWHMVLIAIAVLVGLIALYVAISRGRLNRRLEALRAAGYPTTPAELAEYNRLPAGMPNAAGVYMRAFAAYVPPVDGPNTPYLGTAKLPDRGEPLPEPVVKAISQCLADNQQCLSLLHEAAGIQDCDYDWAPLQATGLSHLADVRHCAQLLMLGTIYHAHAGDPNATAWCIVDGFRLANSLRRESSLINHLVRINCVGWAQIGMEHGLSVTAFTDGQLIEFGEMLKDTVDTLDLAQAMITEQCSMIEMCRNPSGLAGSGQGPKFQMLPGVKATALTDTLDYMEDCIEAAKLPPTERLKAFREAAKKVDDLSFMHFMIKLVAPATPRVAELDLRAHAGIDLARTAVAVERYRLTTGNIPIRLEELTPQYIEQVPIDPFDSRPIRYERTASGYVIYSIDIDAQDNGGRERDPNDRGQPHDWPFIVTR